MQARTEGNGMKPHEEALATAPEWVYRHVEKHLGKNGRVLNVTPVPARGGRMRYLANTTQGAAMLERLRGGEPVVRLLPFPVDDVVFVCSVCEHRMRVSGQELPVDVHCAMCASLHRLRTEATPVLLARGHPPQIVRVPATRALATIEARPVGDARDIRRSTEPARPATPTAPVGRTTPTAPAKPVADDGPYRHGDYTLHTRQVQLTSGSSRQIYFFAKSKPKSGRPCALPDGYEVTLVRRTGMPVLRRAGRTSQCEALTAQGGQCRNTARNGRYCGRHRSYKPASAVTAVDTQPRDPQVRDTLPALRGRPAKTPTRPSQCMAVTAAGSQCRGTNRPGSKYCGRHKGYRPPSASGLLKSRDTKPRSRAARDTKPRVR